MLEQTISSTKPTAPDSKRRNVLLLPASESVKGSAESDHPRTLAFDAASSLALRTRFESTSSHALACSTDTSGRRRAAMKSLSLNPSLEELRREPCRTPKLHSPRQAEFRVHHTDDLVRLVAQ